MLWFFFIVCLHPVSCVADVASVSGLSIPYWSFGFLQGFIFIFFYNMFCFWIKNKIHISLWHIPSNPEKPRKGLNCSRKISRFRSSSAKLRFTVYNPVVSHKWGDSGIVIIKGSYFITYLIQVIEQNAKCVLFRPIFSKKNYDYSTKITVQLTFCWCRG